MKYVKLGLLFAWAATLPLCAVEFDVKHSKTSVRDLLETGKKSPKSDTYYLIALSEARKNNLAEAYKAINTGLSINPRCAKLFNLKGALYAREGKLAEARKMFLTVLQIEPTNKYAKTSLASVESLMQSKSASTVTVIVPKTKTKPEQLSPEAPVRVEKQPEKNKILEASYFMGVKNKQSCYHAMARIKRAYARYTEDKKLKKADFDLKKLTEEKYLSSIPVCPKSGEYSYNGKDVVCSVHGECEIVGSEVTTVFKDFSNGMRAKLNRKYLDALRAFEQVLVLYPRWAEAHYQMGDTLFRLNEADSAMISLRSCLKYNPENLDAQLLLANVYFKKGQKQAALNLLDSIAATHKGTVYALSARSIAASIRSGKSYYQIYPPN